MHYIVLDLEFNQPFPFKTGKATTLEPECPFEIIQIGAVKLNEQFQIIGSFDFLIKPQIYTRVHPYVEKITGIRMSQLENRPFFPAAYDAFLSFAGKQDSVLCTWGIDDIKSLYKNILFYNLDAERMTNKYLNVQNFATQYLNYEPGKNIGLKNAVVELNLETNSPFHNALHDAQYTARIFQVVCPSGTRPDAFEILDIAKKKPKKSRIDMKGLIKHMEKSLQRELTEDEKSLVIAAYKLGKNLAYDKLTDKRIIKSAAK